MIRMALGDIGPLVMDCRARHHWTQAQLATAAGVSIPTLYRVECGERSVKLTTITKGFIALGFGPDTRIELKGDLS